MKISSLIESIKTEIQDLKEEIENIDIIENPNSNVLRKSTNKKNKKTKNNSKNSNFKSPEGISIMNTSLEGQSIEKDSFEGKAILDYFDEKKDILDENILKNDNKKSKLYKLKDKRNLKDYIIFSEILSKPKSLK